MTGRNHQSHLLQMRGLKHFSLDRKHHRHESHLLQMRGLKLKIWIKIWMVYQSHLLQMRGLKHTKDADNQIRYQSHLLQMRGLKLWCMLIGSLMLSRIFYRCVDWNNSLRDRVNYNVTSHLLQMRGLKLYNPIIYIYDVCRIFYRCVDWNGSWAAQRFLDLVASFTDAWIETRHWDIRTLRI